MQALILRAQGWALTALAVLLVLAGAYALGSTRARRAAEKANEADRLRRDLANERANSAAQGAAIEAARVRRDADAAAAAMAPGEAQEALRNEWSRD